MGQKVARKFSIGSTFYFIRVKGSSWIYCLGQAKGSPVATVVSSTQPPERRSMSWLEGR